jgi:large-conductance mechanosensitive channel
MRDWFASLVRGRVLDLALALALGIALATLAETLAAIPTSALVQNVGRNPYEEGGTVLGLFDLFTAPYYLNFSVGGTVIAYGQAFAALLALGLVALTAVFVVRRRDRVLGECPFCASRIPYESTHCAYCGSGVTPGEA